MSAFDRLRRRLTRRRRRPSFPERLAEALERPRVSVRVRTLERQLSQSGLGDAEPVFAFELNPNASPGPATCADRAQ